MKVAQFPFRLTWVPILFALLSVCGPVLIAGPMMEKGIPEELTASDWSGIVAAHRVAQRAIAATDNGSHTARSPSQQWKIDFDGRGFSVKPDSADWRWGLRLQRYEAGRSVALSKPKRVTSEADRMVYRWDDMLQEWFVNTARGLQQGWTFSRAPVDPSDLHLVLDVSGGLMPRISADAASVSFDTESGMAALTYSGLHAWDADGQPVPVRFAALPDEPSAFAVCIDASHARFPVTIDPIAQQAYLKASNTNTQDAFGGSVAIAGDTLVVGALGEDSNALGPDGDQDDNTASSSGAAYVFVRNGETWTQQAYLKASNTGGNDFFGTDVAISGDTLIVGAPLEDSKDGGVNGDGNDNTANASGAAYVFVRNGSAWTQQAYLKASNTGANDFFGASVAISGDTVIVGSQGEDSNETGVDGIGNDNSAVDSGAAYVFTRIGTTWSQQAYLKASNTGGGDGFGISVDVSGDTVVIGASNEDSNAVGAEGDEANNSALNAGAAYVFVREGSKWSQQAYLKASNTDGGDGFGVSVAVSGDTLVAAANFESGNASGVNGNQADNTASASGAAYVFVRNGTAWSQQAYLKASNTGSIDRFGTSAAISGDTVVVGAQFEDSNATGVNGNQADDSAAASGAAYVFARSGSVWSQSDYLKASNTGGGDGFGIAVAISGDTVVVGANGEASNARGGNGDQSNNSAPIAGAGYAFLISSPAPTINASGKTQIITSRRRIVLRGTATDANLVEFKAGKGGFKPAKGTAAKWKIPVPLKKSRIVVKVRAIGPGGTSKILRIVVLKMSSSPAP